MNCIIRITSIWNNKTLLYDKKKIYYIIRYRFLRPLEIANWGPNQPTFKNGTKAKCGAFDGTDTIERSGPEDKKYGYWYNVNCDTKFQALCQKTSKIAPPLSEYESYSCPNVREKPLYF